MTTHPTSALISRYAVGAADVDDATVWAVEAHLESCAACRTLLADAVDPGTRDLLGRVADGIADGIATGPGPVRRRRLRRTGVAARVLPWLATAAGLMLAAVVFERTFESLPSLVLLLSPVAPLLPVAAAWSRRTDPAWELLATMPRAGLWLLLRRTLAVLAVVVPVLAVAGWWTGQSPALWLLPALAFTAGSLALGGLVGVDVAALGLAVAWSAAVVAPSLAGRRLPAILAGGSWPGWAVITVALLAVVLVRAADHRHLGAGRT
ncbi:zf-HC2 domain-containing protein [Plantactinospora sp. S1510]|uniref:Zf-HC2 domain-containing protein n=1 Tax=Plantactinospora alkalitolerans TaxID=2789879 RepID=A0ABS0GXH4_9ACTN|nr:zf-HC2 domain-containing protein [Plantactinospora alkalitolerans]MBF9130673.1 zf-HC2 domain-containing protein [Plantactinospora alkalitolerans]